MLELKHRSLRLLKKRNMLPLGHRVITAGWTQEVRMADRLFGAKRGARPITEGRRPLPLPTGRQSIVQPKGEIWLQIGCAYSDRRSLTQLFVAASSNLGTLSLRIYREGRPSPRVRPPPLERPSRAA
jgi:hypothetical protein